MDDEVETVHVADLLAGLPIPEIPLTVTPLEAIVMLKGLDVDGDVCWFTTFTPTLADFEKIGALNVAHQSALADEVDSTIYGWEHCAEEDD